MDPLVLHNSPQTVLARTSAISDAMLRESRRMRSPNFGVIGADDLARLFRLYDEQFLGGWLAQTVVETSAAPLSFHLSSTMTRAGGKTIRTHVRQPTGKPRVFYEIAIASRMLFMNFGDVDRPVVVCGLKCSDRLSALQRIMEHEIVHLIEFLKWGKSSCSARRFQTMTSRIFGHTEHTHDLVTPRERAAMQHGIRVGDLVQFEFEGLGRVGKVNRIHHRATVLVEARDAPKYSDGKRYKKFYVPLGELDLVPNASKDILTSARC